MVGIRARVLPALVRASARAVYAACHRARARISVPACARFGSCTFASSAYRTTSGSRLLLRAAFAARALLRAFLPTRRRPRHHTRSACLLRLIAFSDQFFRANAFSARTGWFACYFFCFYFWFLLRAFFLFTRAAR